MKWQEYVKELEAELAKAQEVLKETRALKGSFRMDEEDVERRIENAEVRVFSIATQLSELRQFHKTFFLVKDNHGTSGLFDEAQVEKAVRLMLQHHGLDVEDVDRTADGGARWSNLFETLEITVSKVTLNQFARV